MAELAELERDDSKRGAIRYSQIGEEEAGLACKANSTAKCFDLKCSDWSV